MRRFSRGDYSVRSLVAEIRKRWLRSVVARGGALALVVALLLFTILLLVVTTVEVQRTHFILASIAAGVIVCGILYAFVVRPLRNPPSDKQLALFVEERFPDLQDRLNSAVEVAPQKGDRGTATIYSELMRDAVVHAREIRPATVVDQRRERVFGGVAGALFLAFLVFGYQVRDKIQIGDGGVRIVGVTFAEPEVTVFPGNIEIERGAPQEFIVQLREDRGEEVTLVTSAADGTWIENEMMRGIDEQPTFLFEMTDVQEPLSYFVQYGESRSDVYNITLYEFPSVAQIDIVYRYPEYTGLPRKLVENGGDIEALVGTRAVVTVKVGGQPVAGNLVLSDGQRRELARGEAGAATPGTPAEFGGIIDVTADGSYHVELVDAAGKQNRFPVEYAIIAMEDQAPVVSITAPRRDLRANAIEEVLVEAAARDDYGLTSLRLNYSVNGEDEEAIDLATVAGAPEVEGEHLLFLEDYSLAPGDVISYYVTATDQRPSGESAATDMYFIEVIPFDQQFTQVNNQGGLGGGGQSGVVISQQEIIAATWRLQRERLEMDGAEFDELLDGIVRAQENLKATLDERINATAFSRQLMQDEESQQVVKLLRDATAEMDQAVVVLRTRDLKRALTPERKALTHLLRANALNTEQQVTNQQGQGGGGGGGSMQESISELMDLELDISKDKYETQQQASREQEQRGTDDALNKIKELARRQQELADEGRRQQQQDAEDPKRTIDRLKREQDELRRQTEELSRSLDQSGQTSSNQAGGRVAEEMAKAEEALRRGDVEEAMRHQQQALNELQRLQRDLQVSSKDAAGQRLEQIGEDFDALRDQEEQLAEEVREEASGGTRDRDRLQELLDQRNENRERLRELAGAAAEELERLNEAAASENAEARTALRNMLQRMRREDIDENMDNSAQAIRQGWLDFADRAQQEIVDTLERMETGRRALERGLPDVESERLAGALRDTQELQEALRELERLGREGQVPGSGESSQESGGQEGQQGQQEGQGQGQGAGERGDREGSRAERTREAQMERQMERARQALERLQEGVSGEGQRQQLQRLESFLSRGENQGFRIEGEAADAFFNRQAYDPLSQIELELARQLDEVDLEKKLYGTRAADAPPEYRRLIDDYYESLSKDNN